jgi:ubiquinone/menaquinone biosynthesis C-methylase UbiE
MQNTFLVNNSSFALQNLYKRQLFDLGETGNIRLKGILSPVYNESLVNQYVQAQFLELAPEYASKYQNTEYYEWLISKAFQHIALNPQDTKNLVILDIGSGSGNSIFPLLKICSNSFIIASDLSIEMLVLLKQALEKFQKNYHCSLLQLNAEEIEFAPESFDLILGGAILHHLFSPEKTIEGCSKVLKKGGHAIFFEPFENGNIILRIVYEEILNHSLQDKLPVEVRNILRALIVDFDIRKGRNKSADIYQKIDDKWLFTKQYFLELADKYNFSDCIIYPLHATENQFERQTEVNLRLGIGKDRDILPDWAWELLRKYDNYFSEDLKKDLLIEGCILLKK